MVYTRLSEFHLMFYNIKYVSTYPTFEQQSVQYMAQKRWIQTSGLRRLQKLLGLLNIIAPNMETQLLISSSLQLGISWEIV